MTEMSDSIRERYARVLAAVESAARKAGREPASTRVVVVTKNHPLEIVQAAIAAGIRILGENYVEEAVEKILAVPSQTGVEWHMIGHVQSRKVELVTRYFSLFHSLDSLKLARRADRFAAQGGKTLSVLLEFNVSGEKSKHGWPASDESTWPDLLEEMNAIAALPHLKILGMMTMPPLSTDPEESRKYFKRLARLRTFLAKHIPQAGWDELSMGTSSDYSVAVEEGATLVRVGQAILGPRTYPEAE